MKGLCGMTMECGTISKEGLFSLQPTIPAVEHMPLDTEKYTYSARNLLTKYVR